MINPLGEPQPLSRTSGAPALQSISQNDAPVMPPADRADAVTLAPPAARAPAPETPLEKAPGADRFTPLIDDDVFTKDVMSEIAAAKTSIHFETYLLNGPDGKALADLLIAKKNEGVEVKVLLDPAMQKIEKWTKKKDPLYQLSQYLRDNGVDCVDYPVKKLKGSLTPSEHAKVLVIDDRIAYLGGSNIDDTYNHDMNVKVEGPSARYIRGFFDESWQVAAGPDPEMTGYMSDPVCKSPSNVRVTTTSPSRSTVKETVLSNIRAARESISVEMFTLTDDDITKELLAAKARGVDVRVILCDNKEIFHLPTFHVPNLAAAIDFKDAGIPVRWYVNPKFTQMHSKLAVFDHRKVMLGSTNWIHNAFKGIHEYNGEFDDPELAKKLEGQFDHDWETYGKDVEDPTMLQRLLGHAVEAVDGLIF